MDELKTPRQSIKRAMRRGWRAGQVAVEIAIVAPLLALVLVVCADFGRIFYTTVEVDNAARAAAQYASQSTTTAGNTTNIQQAAANGSPGLSGLTVDLERLYVRHPGDGGKRLFGIGLLRRQHHQHELRDRHRHGDL